MCDTNDIHVIIYITLTRRYGVLYSGLAVARVVIRTEKRVRYVTKISPALQKFCRPSMYGYACDIYTYIYICICI
jgi:hypothetical protein